MLLGPPGAGKGTQAAVLSQRLKIYHISTGDILRQNVKAGNAIGRKAMEYMEKGKLVPDEIVIQMVKEAINAKSSLSGFILDGFPRTLKQARQLDELLSGLNKNLDLVIDFKTTNSVIIKRLSGRRICRNCGANYHIKNIPPRIDGVCDKCGRNLYQRNDDKPQTVIRRIDLYRKSVTLLLDYYRKKAILEIVSGDLEVEPLYKVLIDVFKKRSLLQGYKIKK
ncbi:MAG: adenylate kinase [Candidatus Omnitrophota bacterium]|nr:adenylate kinase [Candidatus Omnitrophota bacterium]